MILREIVEFCGGNLDTEVELRDGIQKKNLDLSNMFWVYDGGERKLSLLILSDSYQESDSY